MKKKLLATLFMVCFIFVFAPKLQSVTDQILPGECFMMSLKL